MKNETIIESIIFQDDKAVSRIESEAAQSFEKFESKRRKVFNETSKLPPMSEEYKTVAFTRLIADEVLRARKDNIDVDLRKVARIPTP